LAYGSTFESALAALFGGGSSSLTAAEPQKAAAPASNTGAAQTAAAVNNPTIAEAAKDLADYQRLTAEGNLAEAGQKLEDLKRALDKLNIRH
jgi:hypothetical protein